MIKNCLHAFHFVANNLNTDYIIERVRVRPSCVLFLLMPKLAADALIYGGLRRWMQAQFFVFFFAVVLARSVAACALHTVGN